MAGVALISGASGGIGRAAAERLVNSGWTVYGTSRKADAEAPQGVNMLTLDITDGASVEAAVNEIERREGRLDALVNNAGNGIAGPLEDTEAEELARQIDVNLIGALRLTRACLPLLKLAEGRIVFISSVAGFVPIPFQGCYSMSKYAVEAMAECFRIELAPANVRVSLVEPGDTKTGFTASRTRTKRLSPEYEARYAKSVARMEHDEQNGMSPTAVAREIERALTRRRPPVRITVGLTYKSLRFIKRLLPDRLASFIIGKLYG